MEIVGGPSECNGNYHSDDLTIVALSTGWYKGGNRCFNNTAINANGGAWWAGGHGGDSGWVYVTMGCDEDHYYQPLCPNNIVDASKAVWKAMGVPLDNWVDLDIPWSDE